MRVEFNNCNNIDHGEITIEPGRLNIKYAINGTGKSSIAHALEYASAPDKLVSLTPYKYSNETPIVEAHCPSVVSSGAIGSVAQKARLSALIAKRVMLLIGEGKATEINNIYFSENVPYTEIVSLESVAPSNGIITKLLNGKLDIHCHSDLLIKLLHPGTGYLLFDRVIITATNNITIH